MRLEELIKEFELFCPQEWIYTGDRVGLFCGDRKRAIEKVLLALDPTDAVIEEAIQGGFDLLFTHHPLTRNEFKSVLKDDRKTGKIYRAIQHDLAIYSAHTNLDFAPFGVSVTLAEILGVEIERPLYDKSTEKLYKLVVFVPEDNFELFRKQILDIGIGNIGNYSHCSFSTSGEGTFKPTSGANPYIGKIGKLEKVNELRLETIVPAHLLGRAIRAVNDYHPYEEPALDIYPLENDKIKGGFGVIGNLPKIMSINSIAELCAEKLPTYEIRYIGDAERVVRKVAILGGSGDLFIEQVISSGADLYITGELKHHSALELAEAGISAIVSGHFGTEWIVLPRLKNILTQIFERFDQRGEIVISDAEQPIFRMAHLVSEIK
ncbi:Nif3-like dinuclear metal center hexameric protein [bacterium]|nr:MAG: Nif3-like dinuclear metal center hexameric protein [bacterium]